MINLLTSNRRRPDQASAADVSFSRREAELSGYGGVGLGGVKHGSTKIRRRGVVNLRVEKGSDFVGFVLESSWKNSSSALLTVHQVELFTTGYLCIDSTCSGNQMRFFGFG